MPDSRRIVIHVNSSETPSQVVCVGNIPEPQEGIVRHWRALPEGGPQSDYHRECTGAGMTERASPPPAWQANAWIADRVEEELRAREDSGWNRLEACFWNEAADDAVLAERIEGLRLHAKAVGMTCTVD